MTIAPPRTACGTSWRLPAVPIAKKQTLRSPAPSASGVASSTVRPSTCLPAERSLANARTFVYPRSCSSSSATRPTAPVAPTTPMATSRSTRPLCLPSGALVPDEVVIGAPFAADPPPSSLEHDFRAQRAGVVRRGHDSPVGARESEREQVAAARERQRAGEGQEVAALAERADEVDRRLLVFVAVVSAKQRDRMLGAVENRPDQVVHAAVTHDDRVASCFLHVQDSGDEGPDRADQVPARLEDQRRIELAGDLRERLRVSA